ncbi:MAG: ABC transporter substrate-binding protein [Anaerolineae bacterium]
MSRRMLFVLLTVAIMAVIVSACGGAAAPAAAPTTAPAAAAQPKAAEPTAAPKAAAPTEAPKAAVATVAPTVAAAAKAAATSAPTLAAAAGAAGGSCKESIGASADGAKSKGLMELADAYAGKFKGQKVTMTGPFTGEDEARFNNSIKKFEDATGIDIQYAGSKEFEATIAARIAAADAPDIIDFPQPGLAATFMKQGKLVPTSKLGIPDAWLKENYLQSWIDMAQMPGADGKPVTGGVWQRFNGKDLVWYPKAAFDKAGYKVPTTWDEMMALTDQIAKDGDTPWCIGIESGAATGWPATDWIEGIMLRTTSPQNYDKWVTGDLKFDSPEVRKALDYMSKIWLNDKYVQGGKAKIVTTNFGDAPAGMFQTPPKCWLHKQGNFIMAFFPKTAKALTDYDFFYLPPIDSAQGKPFLVAGDLMAATNDKPATKAVMQWFSTGDGVKGWLAAGGALGPQKDVCLDWYGDPVEKKIAGIYQGSTVVRFDGSDLMPGKVGAGSFWKGMTDWLSGAAPLDTVLKEIDASWPR